MWMNEWMWLCSCKNLPTKAGGELDQATSQCSTLWTPGDYLARTESKESPLPARWRKRQGRLCSLPQGSSMETRHTVEVWVRFLWLQEQRTTTQVALGYRGHSGSVESSRHRDGVSQGWEGYLLNVMLSASSGLLENLDILWFVDASLQSSVFAWQTQSSLCVSLSVTKYGLL